MFRERVPIVLCVVLLMKVHMCARVSTCVNRCEDGLEYSRFDYEYKLLERLVQVEQKSGYLERTIASLTETVAEQRKEIETLRMRANEHSYVVFSEIKLPLYQTLTPGQTLVYTQPLANIGNAYDTTFGFFQAPINGTYSFAATLCSYPNSWIVFGIMHEDEIKDEYFVGDTKWHQCGTSSMVSYLHSGSKVWVKVLRVYNGVMDKAYGISSFTAVLLNTNLS